MLVALRTGYIDEQFAPIVRAVKSLNESWSQFHEMKKLCIHIKQLYDDILTTFQRDASIIPPLVTSMDSVLLPEWEKISTFWINKHSAFSGMKRQKQVCDGTAKDLYDGFSRLKDGINNALDQYEKFEAWANLPGAARYISVGFLTANYGPTPTTPEEIQKAWEKIDWSGYIRTFKSWMDEGITKAKKALKDFIIRGNPIASAIPKQAQQDYAAFFASKVGAPPPKKGERWATVAQVPRGGNVCGFMVVNQVGVHKTVYDELANMLNKVRGILDRKGLSSACANIPIVYRGKEKHGGSVKVLDTGAELPIAGRYYPSEKIIEILFDDKDFNVTLSTDCSRHYPPWMLQVMIHEIGHYYYYNRLSAEARGRHAAMFKIATSFPSSYAKNNPAEDFAELWTAYLTLGYSRGDSRTTQYTMTNDCWERFKAVIAVDPRLKEISRMVAEAKENDWESRLQEMLAVPKEMWEVELKRFLSLRAEVNERKDLQGEHHFNAKLSAKDVVLIRKAAASGFPQNRLAEAFKISKTTISQIVNYRKWKHVK